MNVKKVINDQKFFIKRLQFFLEEYGVDGVEGVDWVDAVVELYLLKNK